MAGAYPSVRTQHKASAQEYCYSHLDGMLLQCMVTPQQYITRNYDLYTWVNRQTKWSKVSRLGKQCDRRRLNPRPPDPELEVLTAQPAHTTCLLPYYNTSFHINLRFSDFCRNFPQLMKPYNHSECMCMSCMLVFITKNKRPDCIVRGFG